MSNSLVKYEPLRGVALSEVAPTTQEKTKKALWIVGGLSLAYLLYRSNKKASELAGEEDCGCGG